MTFKLGDISTGVKGNPCWRKRAFKSLGAAEAAKRSQVRNGKSKAPARINAYGPCRFCGQYHVGHSSWKKETA